jgi:hypothetical protein
MPTRPQALLVRRHTNAAPRSQITDRSDTRASARKLLRTSVLRPSSRSTVTSLDVQR